MSDQRARIPIAPDSSVASALPGAPRPHAPGSQEREAGSDVLLQVHDLKVHFAAPRTLFGQPAPPVRAVDGVDFAIAPGETFALVGESGSGKTTIGKAVIGLVPATAGAIAFRGERLASPLAKRPKPARRGIQMVFQDPASSLNPRRRIADSIADPMLVNGLGDRGHRARRVGELLAMVHLPDRYRNRYPHELSGGERQRVGVARALSLDPALLVLDEPTSALDVSVQARVVAMLVELQQRRRLSYLLITHDLALVRTISHQIGVLYLGRMMERCSTRALFAAPANPYTLCLLTAIPRVEAEAEPEDPRLAPPRLRVLPGDVPSPRNPPTGCRFHTRCPLRQPICQQTEPPLREIAPGHFSRCHFDRETIWERGRKA